MKFKFGSIGVYHIAALIKDLIEKKFYGLLIRFTEVILGFQLILLLCSTYSYKFLEVLLLLFLNGGN